MFIEDFDLEVYCKCIVIVLQDVFFFFGFVMENIMFRDDCFFWEEVVNVVKFIGVYEFIEKLLGGYDYKVMEWGVMFFMG